MRQNRLASYPYAGRFLQPANQMDPFAIAQLAFFHGGTKAQNSNFRYVNRALHGRAKQKPSHLTWLLFEIVVLL